MLHPLFATLIRRPDLVVDHMSAYAALFGQEAKTAGLQFVERLLAWVLAVICGSVFLILSGVALMLGLVQHQFHWILLVVPLAALALTTAAVVMAKKPLPADHFPLLKEQLDADVVALRAAS